jgi:hypothetical protein
MPKASSHTGGGARTKSLTDLFKYLHHSVLAANQSKLFAGLIIITLNISSKFVTMRLSKTMEGYLKYTFSRDILVFAMAWMGTRDIYTALFIVGVFVLFADFLLNEESQFCVLPEHFTTHHSGLVDEPPEAPKVTEQQIADAVSVLANAKKQADAAGDPAAVVGKEGMKGNGPSPPPPKDVPVKSFVKSANAEGNPRGSNAAAASTGPVPATIVR